MISIKIAVTELRPGDQFVADGYTHYTVVESPEPFTHPEMEFTGTSVYVQFADGGCGTRVFDRGESITIERPA